MSGGCASHNFDCILLKKMPDLPYIQRDIGNLGIISSILTDSSNLTAFLKKEYLIYPICYMQSFNHLDICRSELKLWLRGFFRA